MITNRQPNALLRKAREARGWTQADLAALLNVNPMTIGRWERGTIVPPRNAQMELAQIFERSSEDLGFAPASVVTELSPEKLFLIDPMIPERRTALIGRDELVEDLSAQLLHAPTMALHGLPGIGKTALACLLTSLLIEQHQSFDGVLWAGLGPNPTIERHLARWEILLGRSSTDTRMARSPEEWVMALRMAIGTRRMLLVLDDAWHINDALQFQVGGPQCVHLITTRFPNVALQFAKDGEVFLIRELDEQRSLDLLASLTSGIDRSDPFVSSLIRLVNGLPLALTLIGNYLRIQGWSQLSRRTHAALEQLQSAEARLHLSQPLSPFEHPPSLPIDAPLSLQATIEISEQQLSQEAQQAFYALSVFPAKPNSFTEEAALYVAETSTVILDLLIDTGLLESLEEDRYCLHQVIADYANSKYIGQKAEELFVTYYTKFAEKYTTDSEKIEHESGNVIAMLNLAYQRGLHKMLVQGTSAFVPFLLLRGLYDLANIYLPLAYEAAKGDSEQAIPLLLLQGQTAQKKGYFHQAVLYFQQGLALARQFAHLEQICAFLSDLGWVTWKQGNYGVAEEYLREGLALARQINNGENICKFLRVLGAVLSSLGNYLQANEYFQEGLTLALAIGSREQTCVLLIDLGVSFQEIDQSMKALPYLCEGLTLARQMGHKEWMSLALLNLTNQAQISHQYHEAEEYAKEGLTLARQIGHREWTCGHLVNLGICAREQGALEKSRDYFLEAIPLAQQVGRPYMTFMAMYEYACLAAEHKDGKMAEALLAEAHTIIPQGDTELLGLYTFGMARIEALQGNMPEALRLGEMSRNMLLSDERKAVEQWLSKLIHSSQVEYSP